LNKGEVENIRFFQPISRSPYLRNGAR